MSNKMWGGRFTSGPDAIMEDINTSIDFDRHLYRQDIAASKAHADMLAKQGIIAADDARVDLTDLCEDFAGAVIFDVNLLKALVRRAFAERGKMRNRGHDFV